MSILARQCLTRRDAKFIPVAHLSGGGADLVSRLGQHPGDAGGESPATSPVPVSPSTPPLTVYLTNIRSINNPTKQTELHVHLDEHTPDILAVTETWLCSGTPYLHITNYTELGRRDRENYKPQPGTTNWGGIMVYVRNNTVAATLLEKSPDAERLWFAVHSNTGSFLFGLQYRPPDEPVDCLDSLESELGKLYPGFIGVFLFGDFNVHEARWLRFSNGNTPVGARLCAVARHFNLIEMVKAPTRGNYLLDLFLTNHPDNTKVKVLPSIADHKSI